MYIISLTVKVKMFILFLSFEKDKPQKQCPVRALHRILHYG